MHDLFPPTLVCLIRRGHCRLLHTFRHGWMIRHGVYRVESIHFRRNSSASEPIKILDLKEKKISSTIKHEEWIDNDNCSGLILYTIIWGYQRKLEYIYRVPKQGCRVLLYSKNVKDSNVTIKGITYMYLFCFLFSSHTIS